MLSMVLGCKILDWFIDAEGFALCAPEPPTPTRGCLKHMLRFAHEEITACQRHHDPPRPAAGTLPESGLQRPGGWGKSAGPLGTGASVQALRLGREDRNKGLPR